MMADFCHVYTQPRNSHIFHAEKSSCGKLFRSWTCKSWICQGYNGCLWLKVSQVQSNIVVGRSAEDRKMCDCVPVLKRKAVCNNINIRRHWWWSLPLQKDYLLAPAKVSERMGYLPLKRWKYLQETLKGLLTLCINFLKDISKFIVTILAKVVHSYPFYVPCLKKGACLIIIQRLKIQCFLVTLTDSRS